MNGLRNTAVPPIEWRNLLRTMLVSREFDRRAGLLFRQGRVTFNLSAAGHEALAGAALPLRPGDLVFPHYRDRALVMMRGMTVTDMTRDLLATSTSHSGGRNMTAHFSDRSRNIFSIASPVGSQCLPAAGAAWTQKLNNTDNVVLCSIGDASTRQGEFFEAVSWAVDLQLPIVFLVSDNGYGISTPTTDLAPVHRPVLHETLVQRVDGVSVRNVVEAVDSATRFARAGNGPSILWCDLDRLESHTSSDDHRVYRSAQHIAKLRDPVDQLIRSLIEEQMITEDEFEQERVSVRHEVQQGMQVALDEPAPAGSSHEYLFASTKSAALPPTGAFDTIVQAVNGTLRRGLDHYPEIVLFGEDIEDPKGGVFGFTKGLGQAEGGRVFNSPLAEATIIGGAVGLAATGKRPVVELQFIDFVGPAWNQITSQLATLRWRTRGAWTCPVVMYAPYGAYLPGGGIWHSQSNEAAFTHIPGIRVVVVSHPDDAESAFLDAFAGEDPTLILLPKHLMRRADLDRPFPVGVDGGARLVTRGDDVTILAWGNCIELATEAATRLAESNVSAEVIDLVWLAPWDRAAVARSLRKTGRLIVVQEDNRTSSFGASVLADLCSGDEEFFSLLAPPRLVSRDDIHIPFHPELEKAALPTVDDIIGAVLSILD